MNTINKNFDKYEGEDYKDKWCCKRGFGGVVLEVLDGTSCES